MALLEQGFELYVAAGENRDWIYSVLPPEQVLITDPYNMQILLPDILLFSESHNIGFDGVLTFFEHGVLQTALVAKSLGLKGIEPIAALRSSLNKISMRNILVGSGLSRLMFSVATSLEDLVNHVKKIGFPCVIKPYRGNNSYGVRKISDTGDIQSYISQYILECSPEREKVFSYKRDVFLIEEYCSGTVLSIDGISSEGKIHFAGIVEIGMSDEPYFIQKENYFPSRLTSSQCDECFSFVEEIIRVLSLNECAFHAEARMAPNGFELMEIAARPPGGHLITLYKKALGINLAHQTANLALNRPVDLSPRTYNGVLQRGVFIDTGSILTKAVGYKALQKNKHVFEFLEVTKAGERILHHPKSYPKPIYYYGISGSDRPVLEDIARKLEAEVCLTIS